MACGQTGDNYLSYQGPIVGYRCHPLWCVRPLDFLAGNMSHMHAIIPCSAEHLDSSGELPTSVAGSLSCVTSEVFNQREHAKRVDLWSIGYGYLLSFDHS